MGSIVVDIYNININSFGKTTIKMDKEILEKTKITLNATCIISLS
jgi:hypothetical protein